jgi:hypothetical protein
LVDARLTATYGTLQRPYTQNEWGSPDRARVARFISRPDEVALTVRVVDATGAVLQLVDEQPEAASQSALAEALLGDSPARASELSEQATAEPGAATAPPAHVASARRRDSTAERVLVVPKGQKQLHPL